MPEGAAEFAIGDGRKPHGFLEFYDFKDSLVLDRAQRSGVDASVGELRASLFQIGGAQERTDMIGAERRDWHG